MILALALAVIALLLVQSVRRARFIEATRLARGNDWGTAMTMKQWVRWLILNDDGGAAAARWLERPFARRGSTPKETTGGTAMAGKRFIHPNDLRVRGEMLALYLGLAVLGLFLVIFLGISLGSILVVLVIAGAYVKIHQGQLVGGAVKVSDKQLPEVHDAAKTAAERLTMLLPEVYVVQDPSINAYALGFFGKKSVVLNSATVEQWERMNCVRFSATSSLISSVTIRIGSY